MLSYKINELSFYKTLALLELFFNICFFDQDIKYIGMKTVIL